MNKYKRDAQKKVSVDENAKTPEDLDTGKDIVKDPATANAATVAETDKKEVLKKGKQSKKSVSSDEKGTEDKSEDAKKTEAKGKKFCVSCGNPVLDTNIFCANCGNKLK